jgi:transcriptional regulator GlxA family with amidase domain
MGLNNSGGQSAVDIDFFAYAPGVHSPTAPGPMGLFVDFNNAGNQGGPALESGYQSYAANHEVAADDHLAHSDPLVERFERWARGQLADGFLLSEAARAVGTSERTLARRLQSVLGKSPLTYVQDLRVEHAVHLLQTSSASIDQIATQVGYADGVTLRTLIRRKLGRGVRELRAGN